MFDVQAITSDFNDLEAKKIKNFMVSQHVKAIDEICKKIKKDFPDFVVDELVAKLVATVEYWSDKQIESAIQFKEKLGNILSEELEKHRQAKIAQSN